MQTVVPVEWESLGGYAENANITAVSWGPGRLDLFCPGVGHEGYAVYHKYFDGAWGPSMTGWESLGGGNADGSPITAVSWGAGRLDLFYRGVDQAIYHKYFDGAWSDWELLGGKTDSVATAVTWGAGRLDLFCVGSQDGAIYHKYFDGTWVPSVTDWESLGGEAGQFLAAVSWGAGRLDLFFVGSQDGVAYHKYFDGTWVPSMTDWESLGFASILTAVSWGAGRLDLFSSNYTFGNSSEVTHKYFDSGAWQPSMTDWESLGFAPSIVTAVSWGAGRLDLFYRGYNVAFNYVVFHKYFDSGAWGPSMTDWESLGGGQLGEVEPQVGKSNVAALSWSPGRLDLFITFVDNSVNHIYYDGSWKPVPSPPVVSGLHVITTAYADPGHTNVELGWTYDPTYGASIVLDYEGKLTGYPYQAGNVNLGIADSGTLRLTNDYVYTISLTEVTPLGTSAPVSIVFTTPIPVLSDPSPDMSYLVPILL